MAQISKLQESNKGERGDKFKSLSKEVEGLLEKDNLKWKQRAKQRWLQERDINTMYFHQCANQRRKTNSIQKIINDEGKILTRPEDIGTQFQGSFLNFSLQSVQVGMSPKVTEAALYVLNSGGLISDAEKTFIALIPKKKKSPTKSTFVPSKLIANNIIVAYEALHTMNNKLFGKTGYMVLKLDTSKAYDLVEWDFLRAVIRRMDFGHQWIELVMKGVESISYSILANSLEWSMLIYLLETYEKASGQRLNKDKTSIQFSRNTPKETQEMELEIADVKSSQSHERYLGLPTLIGRARAKAFGSILDRVKQG
ncbi:uncharacterized protein LOC121249408 [Juglans microcarpa x Juglans regia]|uniref:uncharacterized protein LOC121249408 n=1 Tax=Juglans microcarpa x Juglans regia TaxID=2249226 RepID=UPI001B7EAAE0|nr:uncharacterized protein LOC121249408 [Juglans microcarpa x Juglans regia]